MVGQFMSLLQASYYFTPLVIEYNLLINSRKCFRQYALISNGNVLRLSRQKGNTSSKWQEQNSTWKCADYCWAPSFLYIWHVFFFPELVWLIGPWSSIDISTSPGTTLHLYSPLLCLWSSAIGLPPFISEYPQMHVQFLREALLRSLEQAPIGGNSLRWPSVIWVPSNLLGKMG